MKKLVLLILMIASMQTMAAGDPEKGKVTGYTCTGCHGIPFYQNAYPQYHVPRLGGQNEAYMIAAIKAYRSGERSHNTMHAQAADLSDQDIADIVSYFKTLNQ